MRIVPKLLEWDSQFFGRKIGKLQLTNQANYELGDDFFDLIYVFSEVQNSHKLVNYECSFQEIRVTFSKKIRKEKQHDSNNIISVFQTSVQPNHLYELAFSSGHESRFRKDPKFSEADFKKLYRAWIDNSFNLEIADEILIYLEESQIVGFVTYKIDEHLSKIGLIAVTETARGRQVGSKLIQAVEQDLATKGIEELHISTQANNSNAMKFYIKLGYIESERLKIKHFWNHDTI